MIKILELFGGIGACSKAFERLNIPHEIVDYVEIDKYAVKSFNAVHHTNFEPQDITEWDKDIDVDFIIHGSPCQDFSVAGLGRGGDEGSGTRSSLMYETLRIVDKLRPKYVIWENVKNLLSKKHRHNFDAYIEAMSELGYVSKYQILNAKDYGIPQNRERVFTVSVRTDGNSDEYDAFEQDFHFPVKQPLEKKLKDILEDSVDEKFYLSDRQAEGMMNTNFNSYSMKALLKDEVTNTLTSVQKDNYVAIKTANRQGYDLAKNGDGIDLAYPNSTTRRGRVGHDVSKTLACGNTMGTLQNYRIRKLTPKECWRLMGFDDSDFERAEKVNSNAQLYKQAGNSIVVNVLEGILTNLFGGGE